MAKITLELLPVNSQVTFTAPEWLVISLFFKYQDLNILQEKLRIDLKTINTILDGLQKKKLVKIINGASPEKTKPGIPDSFWEQMEKMLSRYIGPIAVAVIDEELADLKATKNTLSTEMLYSLVEKISVEIDSPPDRVNFQNEMMQSIKSFSSGGSL